MKRDRQRHLLPVLLLCFLVGCGVDSSPLSSSSARFMFVNSTVGNRVVLPCSWRLRLGEAAPSECYVLWATLGATVFERCGARRWQAEELEGRAEVREEELGAGDCSLIISDVQIGDAGQYESFLVVDGARSRKTRVSLQTVKLSVFDHKSRQDRGLGEDLVLDLHTRQSVRVIFQGRNSSWTDVWMRGDADSRRLEKDQLKERLTIRNLQSSDEGTYKVLDGHGLAVSTVQLYVKDRPALARHQATREERVADGAAHAAPLLLLLLLLVAIFLTCEQTL